MLFIFWCAWSHPLLAQTLTHNNPIYRELAERGVLTTGEIEEVYGVPSVQVRVPDGETIQSFVHSLPSLKKISHIATDRIAIMNKTHYLLVMNGTGNMSTDRNKIFIPLDYSIEPQILPAFLPEAAKHKKFILIKHRLQFLGLYEWGVLKHTFPISSGVSRGRLPNKFVIHHMNEYHNSTLFDGAPMDLALNIGGNYFIHEGIVPGYPASHGCIRIFPLHARFLFYKWAKPGIPGKITD
ncbi:MAG: L,D-transpeptidase [Desulfobacca sp.]|uniref:L,D-transpeptidase n=1 Tax=Desulfobacca sp. TaxID=2067990 RepID=UPI00404AF89A